jgi:hypothetical protein
LLRAKNVGIVGYPPGCIRIDDAHEQDSSTVAAWPAKLVTKYAARQAGQRQQFPAPVDGQEINTVGIPRRAEQLRRYASKLDTRSFACRSKCDWLTTALRFT